MDENKTKICKHCQSEISKKAKVCPVCRKKQGKGIIKWILIVFVAMLMFSCVAGGGEEETLEKQPIQSNVEDDKATESIAEESDKPKESGYVVPGEMFNVDDLKISVNSADTDFTDYEDEYGWYDLEDGMKYISVSFTCQNDSDSDKYVSIYDYDCYADGTLCEQTYNFGNDFMNANLSSGRNVSFDVFFVVPSDAEKIELEYTENIWTDEKIIIKLQ